MLGYKNMSEKVSNLKKSIPPSKSYLALGTMSIISPSL
jgi:hypothetical protein